MSKGQIKITTGIVPPTLPRVEHNATLEVQEIMEAFERRVRIAPALSCFDFFQAPAANFKKVVLKW